MKTGCSLVDFDVFFRCNHRHLKISLNFGGISRKKCNYKFKTIIFHLKIDFYRWENIFYILKRIYSDRPGLDLSDLALVLLSFRSWIFYLFQSFPFSRKLWWKMKITEIAKLPKSTYFPNCQRYRSQILIAQIPYLNKKLSKFNLPMK